ncbi:AMP-binding protein [Streptobacillus moniliformis]|uniref:AMP-dependent synthetase and ligase n=1 Tax=Streptobacillus moniliformis (strain ATCC 14647 / DSM 12112 / NCTC 10651 / 9901) TaxID=519441 RepID=D1AVX1_STRM9|nr:AMP-binding protein [Streptobacillus moniliformis]ACZ01881.1 AMP-dependent synthetase and ligase [Streptobacillus moniliformis DSM 12112]AVL43127.1 AMP-dependent synthetase [Streptobacillus moniliformis]SQA12913.1 Long-chain-fatty-acid--CoA ligase FadD15 [Streptobacillus moniliformis]
MFLNKSDRLAIVDFDGKKISHTDLVNTVKYYSDYVITEKTPKAFSIIMMENRKEWFYAFYSLWDSNLTPVAVDAMSNKNELEYFLNDSGAICIYVSNNTYEVAKEAILSTGRDIKIFNVDEIKIDKEKYEKIEKDERILSHPDMEDIAVMLYTSGTTGSPKGVMLTYGNIYNQILSIRTLEITWDDEQILAVLPFHHILPLMSANIYYMYHEHQYSVVLVEKLSSQEILKALSENDVTMLVLVPRVYKLFYKSIKSTIDSKWITRLIYAIAKKINNKAFSKKIFKKVHDKFGGKLRSMVVGGAKSDIEMIEFFNTLGFDYCEGYGLTETAPIISGNTNNHGYKIGTVGKPVNNIEVKAVDQELWVKGPIVMRGYFNKPEKTSEVLTDDGWFKTGDLVEVDDEGYITIVGRKNAMIVLSNGKNVDPETLEIKFMSSVNSIIKEVGIIGHNDKLASLIVIDRNEAKKLNILNINAYIKDTVEFYNGAVHNYEKILEYKITEDELPKTRIGKVRRFMLKDIYSGKSKVENKENVNEPNTEEYRILKDFIFKMKGVYPEGNKNLEVEFGLDSLDQVELLTFIENSFGLKISEEDFKDNLTLLGLSKYIEEKSSGFTETTDQWKEVIQNAPNKELKDGWLMLLIKPILFLLFKLYFRIDIKGSENIKNEQQIFIANHESFIDGLALSLLIPNESSEKTYTLAINWYFKNAFMKFFAKHSNILLLDINKNIKSTIENVSSALKQGKNVFIFPEGTRTKDGNLGEFKKIFAILSKELNIPVTCLKIDGAFEAYSRYDKFPKPKKLSVKYLGQIKPENMSYSEIVDTAFNMYLEDDK